MISGETTIWIGHGEVFLKESFNKRILSYNFQKILRSYQWWNFLFLNLKTINTRSNWLCWKAQKKFQVDFRFCKAVGCSYVTLLATYPANKNMFKINNRTVGKCVNWFKKWHYEHQNGITWPLAISLFSGNKLPQACLGQLFLEYTPICIQKSTFNFDV